MRPGTALGHDERLFCEIGDRYLPFRSEGMPIRDGDNSGLVKKKQEFETLVRAFRRPHEGEVESAG